MGGNLFELELGHCMSILLVNYFATDQQMLVLKGTCQFDCTSNIYFTFYLFFFIIFIYFIFNLLIISILFISSILFYFFFFLNGPNT